MAIHYTGAIAGAGQSVTVPVDISGSITISVRGTWSGTLRAQVTVDGSNWDSLNVVLPAQGHRIPSLPQNGNYAVVVSGFHQFRVWAESWTSGQADITIRGGPTVYDWQENNLLKVLSAVNRTASGADTNVLRNYFYSNTLFGLTVSSTVNGPVAAPDLVISANTLGANSYPLKTFAGVGTLGDGDTRLYSCGRSWGGIWDEDTGIVLPRLVGISVDWTLTGGQEVTYDLDVFQTV